MSTDFYKIYVHDSSKNDTLKAIQAAYANCDRPMVLFIGTPSDGRRAEDWKKLDTPKFRKFLANEHIVCLKVEDSDKHCKRLARDSKKRINPDGSKHIGEIILLKPSMVLVPTGFDLSFEFDIHCHDFISGYGRKEVSVTDIIRWLEESQELDCYKQAFPYFSNDECETDAVQSNDECGTCEVQSNALRRSSSNERRWTVRIGLDSGEVATALRNLIGVHLKDADIDAEVELYDNFTDTKSEN